MCIRDSFIDHMKTVQEFKIAESSSYLNSPTCPYVEKIIFKFLVESFPDHQ